MYDRSFSRGDLDNMTTDTGHSVFDRIVADDAAAALAEFLRRHTKFWADSRFDTSAAYTAIETLVRARMQICPVPIKLIFQSSNLPVEGNYPVLWKKGLGISPLADFLSWIVNDTRCLMLTTMFSGDSTRLDMLVETHCITVFSTKIWSAN